MDDTHSGGRLDNLDNVESFTAHFMHLFQQNIERDGELHPIAVVVATKLPDDPTPLATPQPVLIPLQMGDEAQKDRMAFVIRKFADVTDANAVLFATEAWILVHDLAEDGGGEEFLKNYVPGSIAAHPKRKEVVLVQLEHRDLSHNGRMWMADILRSGSGDDEKVTLASFKEMDKTMGMSGRFTHLLRRAEDEPS